jgi:hypothetical protein
MSRHSNPPAMKGCVRTATCDTPDLNSCAQFSIFSMCSTLYADSGSSGAFGPATSLIFSSAHKMQNAQMAGVRV